MRSMYWLGLTTTQLPDLRVKPKFQILMEHPHNGSHMDCYGNGVVVCFESNNIHIISKYDHSLPPHQKSILP